MKTWKITLEYDGTKYHGWQEQQNARTIMGALRAAAEDYLKHEVELQGAGRTDAGVHAAAQVAHLRAATHQNIPVATLQRELNERLPADIAVLAVEEAPGRFHARHDAQLRTYVYQISTRKSAFSKRYVWWVREPLDEAVMARAAAMIPGRRDFRLFCQEDHSKPDTSTLVEVRSAALEKQDEMIVFRIEASHFLWRMVRRLAGALVKIGKGELSVEQFESLLLGSDSSTLKVAEWTAPAAGLFLDSVQYSDGEPARKAVQPQVIAAASAKVQAEASPEVNAEAPAETEVPDTEAEVSAVETGTRTEEPRQAKPYLAAHDAEPSASPLRPPVVAKPSTKPDSERHYDEPRGPRPYGNKPDRGADSGDRPPRKFDSERRYDGPPARRPYGNKPDGERGSYGGGRRYDGPPNRPPYGSKPDGERGGYGGGRRYDGPPNRPPYGSKPDGERGGYGGGRRYDGPPNRPPYGSRPDGEKGGYGGDRRYDGPRTSRPYGNKPDRGGDSGERGGRPYGPPRDSGPGQRYDGPRKPRPYGNKPDGGTDSGDRPYRPSGPPRYSRPYDNRPDRGRPTGDQSHESSDSGYKPRSFGPRGGGGEGGGPGRKPFGKKPFSPRGPGGRGPGGGGGSGPRRGPGGGKGKPFRPKP